MNDYYVYVYIDPRNFEEFYYGKGIGSRKDAHLFDTSDTPKTKRIREIKDEGLEPIIRVIARGLTEPQALLVEKTLLWKLGKLTTNIASGHFAHEFRPHNQLHKKLPGFDYQNGVYYYNVGECEWRNWDDYLKYGFISAGHGPRWRDFMLSFNPDDIFVAYLKRQKNVGGFVGVGIIKNSAEMASKIVIDGESLLSLPLTCKGTVDSAHDLDKAEYVCLVEWIKAVPREQAKWRASPKVFTTPLVRASLEDQPDTRKFIEAEFGVDLRELSA